MTAKSVTESMIKSMKASPAFQVSARLVREGRTLELEVSMSPEACAQHVFEKGVLIFAERYEGVHRQEYVPSDPKKFDDQIQDILVEYTASHEMDTWSRFMDHDFSCGVLGAIGDSWLRTPEVTEGFESMFADGALSEETVRGIPCYKLHQESRHGTTDSSYDLYVDKGSFLPVRQLHKSLGPEVWSKDFLLDLSVRRIDVATPVAPFTINDLKAAKPSVWPSDPGNP